MIRLVQYRMNRLVVVGVVLVVLMGLWSFGVTAFAEDVVEEVAEEPVGQGESVEVIHMNGGEGTPVNEEELIPMTPIKSVDKAPVSNAQNVQKGRSVAPSSIDNAEDVPAIPTETFSYTYIPIEHGNFIYGDVDISPNTEGRIEVNLIQGKSYLYTLFSARGFTIKSPSGEVLKAYPENGGSRKNMRVASAIEAKESGVHTIYIDNVTISTSDFTADFSFTLYELVDSVSDIPTLEMNNGENGQYPNRRAYAVWAHQSYSYLLKAGVTFTNPTNASVYANFFNTPIYRANPDSPNHMDDYDMNVAVFGAKIPNNKQLTQAVYNPDANVFANVIEWRTTHLYADGLHATMTMGGYDFTPKTGDAAKQKVLELNAEDRGESLVADPVDAFAGNFVDNRTLLSYSGANPLAFSLSYDSIANDSWSLGGGFTHNFETRIETTESGLDLYWTPNSVVRFTKDGASYHPVSAKQIGVTVEQTDTGFRVTDARQQVYVFDESGTLLSFTDKVGLVTTYQYENNRLVTVTNEKGQSFAFRYTDAGKVADVTDSTGRTLVFAYESTGRLATVTTPKGNQLAISYANVASIHPNYKVSRLTYAGTILVENQYDIQGRIVTQYDGNRNKTTFTYDEYSDDNRITTKVTTGDRTETLVHDKDGNLLTKTDGAGFTVQYTYDENRNMVSETDKNGQVFTYEYDSLNRVTKVVRPDDSFITYAYDDMGNVTNWTTEDGLSVASVYEGGQLRSMTDKSGVEMTYTYDAFGNVTEMRRADSETVSTYDERGYMTAMMIVSKDGDEITSEQTTSFDNDALGRVTKTTLPDGSVTKVTYDADNNITSSTNRDGKTATYSYNAFGNKIEATDVAGVVTTYTYDNNGNLVKEKTGDREVVYTYNAFNELTTKSHVNGTAVKNKETYTYNKRGDVTKFADGDGIGYSLTYDGNGNITKKTVGTVVESYEYNAVGHNVSVTDGKGYKTTYKYDALGNVVQETSPSGAVRTYDYDAMNRLVAVTDGEGHKTTYAYDTRGNLIKETKSNGAVTQYEYNVSNQRTAVINALGKKSEYVYNELGQLIEVQNALGEVVSSYAYNALGQVSELTDGNGHTQTFTYDAKGNLLTVTDAYGHVVEKNDYNQYDELVKTLDALGNASSVVYDGFGNASSTTDSKGNTTTYTYSAASRLTGTTDAAGTNAGYQYNGFGQIRQIGQTSAMRTTYVRDNNLNITEDQFILGVIKYAYDEDNNLVKETNARSQSTTYEYDKNGRVVKETAPEGVTTHTYDEVGNRLTTVTGDDSITRTYDALGRVVTKTQNGQTVEYAYDERDHLTELTYPNGKSVDYTYDVMGNMLSVTDWNGRKTVYTYNKNNQLVKTVYENGTSEVRTYNDKGELTKLENLSGTKVVSSYTYEYDASGNIVKENDTVLAYDALNRLTSMGDDTYTYSPFGNITNFTTVKDGQPYQQKMTYGYDSELRTVNDLAVSIDKSGNLLTYKLNNKTYVATYDSKNLLTSFDGVSYRYDAENTRIGVTSSDTVTDFVVDNDGTSLSRVLLETTGDDSTYYVYGNGLIGAYTGEQFETYHYDYRGSTTAVTDEDGVVIGAVAYDAYGVITQQDDAVDTRFLYNGKYGVQTDANGLYHMRARFYNPDLKRFMNRDVVTGSIEQSQTLNRYAYVNGNPISYHDPFGLAREAIGHTSMRFSDMVHLGLDGFGLIPGIGEFADGANALLYLAKGDYKNASLSAAAMIPVVGSSATVGKHAAKYAGNIADLAKKEYDVLRNIKYKKVFETSAEDVNKWWKEKMGYSEPPYKPGTIVQEIELVENNTFVRVYDGENSGMYGGWFMQADDIKGLNPLQIQDKFALPTTPKFIVDVELNAGTKIRTGIVNPLFGFTGGGQQFDLIGQRVGNFINPRPLP